MPDFPALQSMPRESASRCCGAARKLQHIPFGENMTIQIFSFAFRGVL
jgi:hypothetical protein